MKRNTTNIAFETIAPQELLKRTIYHEAGHAAAIHLYNQQKSLPPIFFQIKIEQLSTPTGQTIDYQSRPKKDCIATVEGGRLLQSLPVSTAQLLNDADYLSAVEADIVNLLVGPIAEAKYVSARDHEDFHQQLLTFDALIHYGGASDIAAAKEYLEYYPGSETQRLDKAKQLFTQAFHFVNDASNWCAIVSLADYILSKGKQIVHCEEIIAVLDEAAINAGQNKRRPVFG